jgi:hypothetical protein
MLSMHLLQKSKPEQKRKPDLESDHVHRSRVCSSAGCEAACPLSCDIVRRDAFMARLPLNPLC